MHIPRSQRGQNGTVIILINGSCVQSVMAGSLQLLSSHHVQAAEQMDGLHHHLFCFIYL